MWRPSLLLMTKRYVCVCTVRWSSVWLYTQLKRTFRSLSLCVCAGVWHRIQPRRWWKRYVCLRGSRWIRPHVWPPAPGAQHHHLWRPPAPPAAPPLLEQAGPQLLGHNGHGRHGGQFDSFSPSLAMSLSTFVLKLLLNQRILKFNEFLKDFLTFENHLWFHNNHKNMKHLIFWTLYHCFTLIFHVC